MVEPFNVAFSFWTIAVREVIWSNNTISACKVDEVAWGWRMVTASSLPDSASPTIALLAVTSLVSSAEIGHVPSIISFRSALSRVPFAILAFFALSSFITALETVSLSLSESPLISAHRPRILYAISLRSISSLSIKSLPPTGCLHAWFDVLHQSVVRRSAGSSLRSILSAVPGRYYKLRAAAPRPWHSYIARLSHQLNSRVMVFRARSKPCSVFYFAIQPWLKWSQALRILRAR